MSSVRCHGSSPTTKKQRWKVSRWSRDTGIGTVPCYPTPFGEKAVRDSNCSRYCAYIRHDYRTALFSEDHAMYMNFLDWMARTSREKKKQTYDEYWRRLCQYFALLAKRQINGNT